MYGNIQIKISKTPVRIVALLGVFVFEYPVVI